MKKMSREAKKIMMERFGKDTVIALATARVKVCWIWGKNEMVFYAKCFNT